MLLFSTSVASSWKNIENEIGEAKHPYFKPKGQLKNSVSPSLLRTHEFTER